MNIVFPLLVAAQVIVLIGMVAVSKWGGKHIDPDERIPVRLGTSGFDYTKSKNTTLIYTPVIGLVIVGATVLTRETDLQETMAAIGLAIMLIFLAAHRSAVKRAAR